MASLSHKASYDTPALSNTTKILATIIGVIIFLIPFCSSLLCIRIMLFFDFIMFCIFVSLLLVTRKTLLKEQNELKKIISESDSIMANMQESQKELIFEEKLSAISKYSSVVSHEIRNHLSSMKNIAYYLSRVLENKDDKTTRMIEILSSGVDNMDSMITSLSGISHLRKMKIAINKASDIFEKCFEETKFPEQIKIVKDIEDIELNVDAENFCLLIKNLCSNSIDAMPDGGEINISLKKCEQFVNLLFSDTGSGMDKETLEHIFDAMFTTKTKVLGLGLTAVREIVRFHKGTIEVSSEQGKGTTYHITIPL